MKELNEASLSRIQQHTQNRNIGTVSAFRYIYPEKENLQRSKALESDLRAAGFGFIKMKGHFIEGFGTKDERPPSEEVSYFVIGTEGDDGGRLKGVLKGLGRKYSQDSILYKPSDSEDAVLIGTSAENEEGQPVWPGLGTEVKLGPFHPNKLGQFYTQMKAGSRDGFDMKPVRDKEGNVVGKRMGGVSRTFVFDWYEEDKTPSQRFAEYIRMRDAKGI